MVAKEWDALDHVTTHSHVFFGGSPHSGISKHTTTNPLGHATVEEFDKQGNLIASTDPLGNVTRHEYDSRNRRVKTTGPDGTVIETLSYTKESLIASRTDPAGNKTQYGYDKEGHLTSITDALGGVTKTAFDALGSKTSTTDPLGRTWKFENDAGGRLVRTIGPDGKETERRAYDDQGRVTSITDAAGNTSRTTYDYFGRVTSRTDALERVTKYAYDVKQGAVGCTACTACTASAMPTRITMPSGRIIERVYDADRRLVEESSAGAPPAAKVGQAAGLPVDPATQQVAPLSPPSTRHAYDLAGNLTSTTDPLGRTTSFEYDAANRRVKTINPDQTTRTATYDAGGHLITETNETGATTKRGYNAYGDITSVTDATGGTLSFLYEAPGAAARHRLTGTLSASGVRTDFHYDALWRKTAEIKGALNRDGAIEALKSEIPNPKSAIATTRHEYDAAGNEVRAISPTGKITTHEYDARNRRILTAEPLGRVWKFVHADNAGPSGPAPCCGGDPGANSKAVETILPDGAKESRVLDAAGQLVKTTDAKGDSIAYTYDPDGRLETLTDAKGNVTRWTYDARGKLSAKIYPDKTMELYEHDAAGQMIRRTRPDGTGATYVYDMRGKLTSIKWDGDKAEPSTFAYDPAGRMTLAKNLSATVEREYDARGRMQKETQIITASFDPQSGPVNPANPVNPVEKPAALSPYTVAYTHNADGQLHSITYPDGTIITYLYNSRGELAEVIDSSSMLPAPGTPRPLATYERRADGTIAKLTLANGVVTTRTHDAAGRLAEIKHTDANGKILESEASRYDARDRRTARIRGDGTADLFSYDPAGQVVAAAYGQASSDAGTPARNPNGATQSGTENTNNNPSPVNPANPAILSKEAEQPAFTPTQTFAYDAAGNRMKTTDQGRTTEYTANANNQYTAIAEDGQQHEPDYDKSGNLLHDATRKFTWDADIHLMSVTTQTEVSGQKSEVRESFRYDALHRRVARTESTSQLTTYFVHDGWNVIAEYCSTAEPAVKSSAGLKPAPRTPGEKQPAEASAPDPALKRMTTLAIRHVWSEDLSRTLQGAGGIGGLLSSTHFPQQQPQTTANNRQPSQTYFFSYDSNGNVILLTDARCLTAAKYRYDAFGKTISATGKAAELNRYRFSTKPVESASGLAYFGYRYYDSQTGRWPSRDPLQERDGHNLYSMVENEAPNKVDRLGLSWLPPWTPIVTVLCTQSNVCVVGSTMQEPHAGEPCRVWCSHGWGLGGFYAHGTEDYVAHFVCIDFGLLSVGGRGGWHGTQNVSTRGCDATCPEGTEQGDPEGW
ncbi:MAG: hypothetical protein K1X78_07165 [Verrucomicrobiaceae bacterium]|nr:hypothetical protein [Verrucomicrobiaceae bacterium]